MSIKKYFRCRSIEGLVEQAQTSKTLTRSLNAFQLVMLGIGGIIGGGIFVFTGTAAANHAGPAIPLSFILAGLACTCVAFCYAELASMIPISGSAYTYAYSALGELPAWIIACLIIPTYCLTAGSVASGWSGYVQSLLSDYGIAFPARLSDSFGEIVTHSDGTTITTVIDLPVVIIMALVTYVVFKGSKTSAWVNTIIVLIKMSVLFMFIVLGLSKIDPINWQPFIPQNTGVFGQFGWSGILAGASVILLAYTGFDVVACAAQETKNPRRDLPIGIIGSLIICIVIYVIVSGLLTGVVSYNELNVADPIAVALNKMGTPWFSVVIKIGAICGLTTVVLILTYGAIRVAYAVAIDGLLPKFLTKVHQKTHTPYALTIIIGLIIATIGSLFPVHKLVQLANLSALITFIIVCLGTMYLRYKKPTVNRHFKCPFVPFVPLLGSTLLMTILFSLPVETYIYAGIWLTFMLGIYFAFGCKNSHLLNSSERGAHMLLHRDAGLKETL